MSFLIVIPARFASSRYPGKPLVELRGATGVRKSLLERSWIAAQQVKGQPRVVVATDDERIKSHAEGFGADVVMTSSTCVNGTERCAEAHLALGATTSDVVVNLQGDAPLTPHWFIEDLVAGLASSNADMATPVLRCDGRALNGFLDDRKAGRVGGTTAVFNGQNEALYFSKEVIPFVSETYDDDATTPVFHHVGVYAYTADGLSRYSSWKPGPLEELEGLEQLRFLENGAKIQCVEVDAKGRKFWELNNPEDVPRIEAMLEEMNIE